MVAFLLRNYVSLFVISLLSLSLAAQDKKIDSDPEFVLIREEPSISLHERWIHYPGKTPPVPAREVKGEFHIDGSIYTILKLIKDETQIHNWQNHVGEFKVYPKPDTNEWHQYTYYDAPWPVSDQDHFVRYTLIEKSKGTELLINFESDTNYKLAPLNEDVTRLEINGSWHMQQLAPNKAKVTYRVQSMPGGAPRMLTDPVVRGNLMSSIRSLKELAEK